MAGNPAVRISFAADTAAFTRGTKDVVSDLKDVQAELKDTARAGETTEQRLKRAWQKAERAVDDYTREVKGAAKTSGDAGREVGNEFTQNLGETIGSASNIGTVEGAVDMLLGTLGGSLPALGPAGPIAALGTLVGGVIAMRVKQQKDRLKEAGAELFTAMRDGMLEQADQEALVMKVLGVEDWSDALRMIADTARETGLSAGDIFASLASGKPTAAVAAGLAANPRSTSPLDSGQYRPGSLAWENLGRDIGDAATALTIAAQNLAAQTAIGVVRNPDYPGPASTAEGYNPFSHRRP